MPEQVPNPTPSSPTDGPSSEDFDKRLKGLYCRLELSQEQKDFVREMGLI